MAKASKWLIPGVALAAVVVAGTAMVFSNRPASPPVPLASGSPAADDGLPDWLFYGKPQPSKIAPDTVISVPGSTRTYTWRQVKDVLQPPDWFPQDHAPMPAVVARGTLPDALACGYCHLPGGQGRPENARVAGLPRAYIMAQMKAMASGDRQSAQRGNISMAVMADVARAHSDAELEAAATYFAASKAPVRLTVREATRVPVTEVAGFALRPAPGAGDEPLGQRIIELASDFERHEARDGRIEYTAWVPPGSIERGRKLALSWGPDKSLACETCHGPGLRGSEIAPPLAGQFPGYTVRQLLGFKTGARKGGTAEVMRQVTAGMSLDDQIALAAWTASLKP